MALVLPSLAKPLIPWIPWRGTRSAGFVRAPLKPLVLGCKKKDMEKKNYLRGDQNRNRVDNDRR